MPESTNQSDPGTRGPEQQPEVQESSAPQDPHEALFTRKERSLTRDLIYLVVLVLMIGSVVILLASTAVRTRLLERLAESWRGVTGQGEQTRIFALPAPPPKSVPPKIVYQGTRGGIQSDRPPVIIRSPGGDEEQGTPGDEARPPAPPEKTDASKSAYDTLLQKSPVAQKIATGGFEGYNFKEWRPLQNAPPEFWVDLVATGPNGSDTHFVWMINIETGAVEPKSQGARDAELRAGRR